MFGPLREIAIDPMGPLEPGMVYPVKGLLTFEALREIERQMALASFMRASFMRCPPTRDELFIKGRLD